MRCPFGLVIEKAFKIEAFIDCLSWLEQLFWPRGGGRASSRCKEEIGNKKQLKGKECSSDILEISPVVLLFFPFVAMKCGQSYPGITSPAWCQLCSATVTTVAVLVRFVPVALSPALLHPVAAGDRQVEKGGLVSVLHGAVDLLLAVP